MIKHIWSVLCQNSIVDSQSNNISLMNALERLEAIVPVTPGLPKNNKINLPMQYELVNFWTRTKKEGEEKADVQIVLIDPDKTELNRIDKEVVIPADKIRIREINKIQGIALTKSGLYNFVVSIKQKDEEKYKVVAELPLEVQINKTTNKLHLVN